MIFPPNAISNTSASGLVCGLWQCSISTAGEPVPHMTWKSLDTAEIIAHIASRANGSLSNTGDTDRPRRSPGHVIMSHACRSRSRIIARAKHACATAWTGNSPSSLWSRMALKTGIWQGYNSMTEPSTRFVKRGIISPRTSEKIIRMAHYDISRIPPKGLSGRSSTQP